MSRDDVIEMKGKIVEILPNSMFKVELETGGVVLAHLAGRMRIRHIRIMPGDAVKIEMTPYDLARGRITDRLHKEAA